MSLRAYLATRTDDHVRTEVTELEESALPEGEVTVDVEYSGLNFKDAMVVQPRNSVARRSPLIPGVDLAGRVRESSDRSVSVGSTVLVHGYHLGVSHDGGFAQVARVPAGWVVPLPEGLDARQAMIVGTAGYTAHLSLRRLERAGLTPSDGPVLVTGASGGVGSMAAALFANHGFHVVASTGKASEHEYLRRLGAAEVVGRDFNDDAGGRVLAGERWAGAVDCVGGGTLAEVLRSLRYGGAVAASGLTGGPGLTTTVYPFIIRGVSLLGIDTVQTPIGQRRRDWEDLARSFPRQLLEEIVNREIGLEDLDTALAELHAGKVRGRVLLRP